MKLVAKYLIGVAGLVLVSGIGYGAYKYSVDNNFKHIIDKIVEAEHIEDIVHYAVTDQQAALTRVSKPNLFLKLAQRDLDKIEPSLLKLLQTNNDIKKAGFTISGAHLGLSQQALSVNISGDYDKDKVKGALSLSIDVALRSVGNQLIFDPYLKGAKINSLNVFGINLDLIKDAVNLVLPLLKDAISDGLRATLEPLTATLKIQPPQISNFKELSNTSTTSRDGSTTTTNVEFVPRPFVYNPTIHDIVVYLGQEGLLAAASVQNLPMPAPKPAKPVSVAHYPDVKQADTDAAYAKYKTSFLTAFETASGQKVADAANLAVSKGYVAQTVHDIVAGTPIAAKIAVENKTEINSDIKLASEVDLQCGSKLNACQYKDVCAQQNPCKETVKVQQETVKEKICTKIQCLVPKPPPLSGCLKENPIDFHCDEKITEWVDKLNDTISPICNGFRAVAAVTPGMCQVASNLSKANCDVFAAHNTLACQAEQEFNNTLARNPFAEVFGDAVTKGSVDASASNLTVSDDFKTVSTGLSAKGSAHVNSHINLRMKKGTLAQAVCNPTWTGDPQADVSVDVKDIGFAFALRSHEMADDKLKLAYETPDEKDIKINLSQSPIEIIRTATAGATLRCDRVGAPLKLASIAMSLDANLRAIEALTRKLDIPQKLGKQKFQIDLPSFGIQIGADKHELLPLWGDKVFGFNLK